jgi:serine/threonine-protein kinase
MSPEQMQAPRTVDVRTDIWSIGVILYELIAGSVPFPGDTLPQISVRVAKSPPPMLRILRSEVPAGLETVIERCLEKNAKKRYKSVADLAAALGRFGPRKALSSVDRIRANFKNASERPFSISLPPEDDVAPRGPAGTSPSSWGAATTRDQHQRNRRHTAAALLAAAAALAAVGAWLVRVVPRGNVPEVAPALATQPPPARAIADDPTRAYAVAPGAIATALAPPTGTGASVPPPARQVDTRHSRQASPHPSAQGASETAAGAGALPIAPVAAAAKGGSCLLNLSSATPSTVILDGHSLGASPRLAIAVWAGSHTVVFRAAEGQTKRTVTCAAGDTKTVEVKLGDLPPGEGSPNADPCPLCDRP